MDNYGFRVLPKVKKVPDEIIDIYKEFVTPNISDNLNRLNAVDSSIRPIHTSGKLIGTAFTVKTAPGDNLLVHKAIDMCGEGDVVIVDAGGDLTNAIMGEIMVRLSKKNGIAGFIVNGAIRDYEAIRNMNYPLYAKGITHRGPYKNGPGEINVPIQVGGCIINPGDLILGDMDGVIAVPFEYAEELSGLVINTMEKEQQQMNDIEKGILDRGWVDKMLLEKGCTGI